MSYAYRTRAHEPPRTRQSHRYGSRHESGERLMAHAIRLQLATPSAPEDAQTQWNEFRHAHQKYLNHWLLNAEPF